MTATPDVRGAIGVILDNAATLLWSSSDNLTDAQRGSVTAIIEQVERLREPLKMLGVGNLGTPPLSRDEALAIDAEMPPSIFIAEDNVDILAALVEILRPRYEVTFARDGAEAAEILRRRIFDLAIFDVGLPIFDGFALIRVLRAEGRRLPTFMFLSGVSSSAIKVEALSLGAVDYVSKPFEPEELLARIAGILAAASREAILRADARTDPLTGLGNYKSFAEGLDRELERSRRYALPISLLVIDVDGLKSINDEHGHEAGDEAIRTVARVLAGGVRRFEIVARQGGDEFAIVLPSTACPDARRLAERLRSRVGNESVRGGRLSISIGGASWEGAGPLEAARLIKASDEALYRAKRAGRDRVELDCAD